MVKEYLKPKSIDEALAMKTEGGADALFLAGGTEVNRLASPAAAGGDGRKIIDIEPLGLELGLNKIEKRGKSVVIGAMVTLQQLLDESGVPESILKAAYYAGSRPLRHMATVGGNIAADRVDSYLLPPLLALDARLLLAGEDGDPDGEEVELASWLEQKRGLITAVIIPEPSRCVQLARISRTVQGPVILTAAYSCREAGGALSAGGSSVTPGSSSAGGPGPAADTSTPHLSRLVIGGLPSPPRRYGTIEKALDTGEIGDAGTLEARVKEAVEPKSDFLGSADYKRYIAGITAGDLFRSCTCKGRV
jgi:putative selenate reductase FAD-binding subunit